MTATPQMSSPSGVKPNQTCENSRPERVVGLSAYVSGVGHVSLAPSSKLFNLNYSGAKAAAVFPGLKISPQTPFPPVWKGTSRTKWADVTSPLMMMYHVHPQPEDSPSSQ